MYKLLLLILLFSTTIHANTVTVDERKVDLCFSNGVWGAEYRREKANWDKKIIQFKLNNPKLTNNIASTKVLFNTIFKTEDHDLLQIYFDLAELKDGNVAIHLTWDLFMNLVGKKGKAGYLVEKGSKLATLAADEAIRRDTSRQINAIKSSIKQGHSVIVTSFGGGKYFTNKSYDALVRDANWMSDFFYHYGLSGNSADVKGPSGHTNWNRLDNDADATGQFNGVTNPQRWYQAYINDDYADNTNTSSCISYFSDDLISRSEQCIYEDQPHERYHDFSYYMSVAALSADVDNSYQSWIIKHKSKKSQWHVKKELGCGCNKRALLEHNNDSSMNFSEDNAVLSFNENGKVYEAGDNLGAFTYVKASESFGVYQNLTSASENNLCYLMEDTDEKIEGVSSSDQKTGPVEITLSWMNNDANLDIDIFWNGGEVDIKDTSCTMEHFVVQEQLDIKPNTYALKVKLKESFEPSSDINDTITIEIKALNNTEFFTIPVSNMQEYDLGHVADIVIKDTEGQPTVHITPDKNFENSNFTYSTLGGSLPISKPTCNPKESRHSCGCTPCSALIIPYLEQALAGPLSDASLKLYIANDYLKDLPFYNSRTSSAYTMTEAGIINIPADITNALNDNELYIIEASKGTDIDSDDNFVIDSTPVSNQGKLRALVSGKQIKEHGYKINILTEIAYQVEKGSLSVLSNSQILDNLDALAGKLLKESIYVSPTGLLDYTQIIKWIPSFNKEKLFLNYNTYYAPIVEKIYRDLDIYDDVIELLNAPTKFPRVRYIYAQIPENISENSHVATIEILDSGDSPINSIKLTGEGSENFFLDGMDINVSKNALIDYESNKNFHLGIEVKNATATGRGTLDIKILDKIDAPYIISYNDGSIFNNAKAGEYVSRVVYNQGASIVKSIQLVGLGSNYFTIDVDGTIKVSNMGLTSIKEDASFKFRVYIENDHGKNTEDYITIKVQVIKDIPIIKPFTAYVDEHAKAGTLIKTIDFSSGQSPIDAFVLSGIGSENFTINLAGELRVSSVATLNYIEKSTYSLSLGARNIHGESDTVPITIFLNNLPDIPVIKSNLTFTVNEGVSSQLLLDNILQSDGGAALESIDILENDGTNKRFFANLDGSLYIKDMAEFDYESATTHFLKVIATNKFGTNEGGYITVKVNDLVDIPVVKSLNSNIKENLAVGSLVGKTSIFKGTSDVSSVYLSGSGADRFSIDLNGTITTNQVLNYEEKSNYSLNIYAVNESGKSNSARLNIAVVDLLDAPKLKDATWNLNENSKDMNLTGSIVVESGLSDINRIEILYNGKISTDLASDTLGNVTLLKSASLDFEVNQNYIYTATAFNDQGYSKPVRLTLAIVNLLDDPELESLTASIDENVTVGTVVGNIIYKDGLSEVLSMRLVGTGSNKFTINKFGEIKTASLLDYETTTDYFLKVSAVNAHGSSSEKSVHIVINDVEDSPRLEPLNQEITEDLLAGDLVGTISSLDGLEPILSFALSGDGKENFIIDNSGTIRLKNELQAATQSSYHLYAQAFSRTYSSNIVDIIINVKSVNKIAKAGVGRWADANVEIYKLESNGTKTLKYEETTSSGNTYAEIGNFNSHRLELEADSFYLYKVSGGEEHDVDVDGILDQTPTPNLGSIHAIIKGSWVRKLEDSFVISMMSDMYYHYVLDELNSLNTIDFTSIENKLLQSGSTLTNGIYKYDFQTRRYFVEYQTAIDALLNSYYAHPWKNFDFINMQFMHSMLLNNNMIDYRYYIMNGFIEIDSDTPNNFEYLPTSKKIIAYIEDNSNFVRLDDTLSSLVDPNLYISLGNYERFISLLVSQDEHYLFVISRESPEEAVYVEYLKIYDISILDKPASLVSSTVISDTRLEEYNPFNYKNIFLSNDANILIDNQMSIINVSDKTKPVIKVNNLKLHTKIQDAKFSSDNKTIYCALGKGGIAKVSVDLNMNMTLISNTIFQGNVDSLENLNDTSIWIGLNKEHGKIQELSLTDFSLLKSFDMPTDINSFLETQEIGKFLINADNIYMYNSDNNTSTDLGIRYIHNMKSNGDKLFVEDQCYLKLYDISDLNNINRIDYIFLGNSSCE